MITHMHMDTAERSTPHGAQKLRAQTAVQGPGCGGDNKSAVPADPVFGLMMGQLLGTTASDAQQITPGQGTPVDPDSPVPEKTTASIAVTHQASDSALTPLGEQGPGEAPKEKAAADMTKGTAREKMQASARASSQTPESSRIVPGVQDPGEAKEEPAATDMAKRMVPEKTGSAQAVSRDPSESFRILPDAQDARALKEEAAASDMTKGMAPDQTPVPAQAVSSKTPETFRTLPGVRKQEKAPKKDGAAKAVDVLSGGIDNNTSDEELMTEMPFAVKSRDHEAISTALQDKTDNGHLHASDDKKILPGPAQAGDRDPSAQQGAFLIEALKDHDEPRHPEDKNASVPGTTDIVMPPQHGQSTVLHQVTGARAADPAEGPRPFHANASDPAEMYVTSVSLVRDGNRLQVKLEPAELGKLDINLNLKDGVIHAQITVQDEAVKNLIERNSQQLVDTLLKEGLSVGGFSVSLQKGDTWEGSAGNTKQETADKVVEVRRNAAPARSPAARSLVNIFV